MSFESSSPRRFESTARMVGVIPLYARMRVCGCRCQRTGLRPNSEYWRGRAYLEMITTGMSCALQYW